MRVTRTTISRFLLALGLAAALLPALPLHAQEAATIDGTVTDPSGAVVPKANVDIVRQSTGATVRSAITNSAGVYSAPDLAIGSYTVRVTAPGFKAAERTGIVLHVNTTAEANIRLSVGSHAETVVVQANPVAPQSQTSDLSTLVSGTQINQIDTNGRDLFKLTELVPGASSNLPNFNNPVAENTDHTISFNGLNAGHNLYLLDGGEINDRGCSGCWDVTPSQNAIAEEKVISGNAPANIGMASGGFVALSMKSGTRNLHGEVWEYNRNDAYDANDYFAKQSGTAKPELRYNIYGFNFGGPFVIPGVYDTNRKRTFFFYNMEWRRLVQGQEIFATGIPAAQFSGNFGSSTITVPETTDPAAVAKFAQYGLTPGEQFPNNTIPAGLLDANVQRLLKEGIFPAANTPDGQNYSAAAPQISNLREEAGRVDHHITKRLSLMTSFLYDSGYLTSIPPGYGATYPTDGSDTISPSYAVQVHLTDAISPSVVNESEFNYTGNQIKVIPTGIYQLPSGYDASSYYTGNNTDKRIPDINLGQPYGVTYTVGSNPWYNLLNIWIYRDNLSWTHARHTFQFGGELLLLHKYQEFFGSTQGTYNFSGSFTGNSFADFLLGYASGYSQLEDQSFVDTAAHTLALYGLDNWNVTNRLTLNLGLRWVYIPHTYDLHNRLSNFDPAAYNSTDAATFNADGSLNTAGPGFQSVNGAPYYMNGIVIAGQNGTPRGLVHRTDGNFGPRLGFAYELDRSGATVLRGGFGMYYERIGGGDTYGLGPNPPFSNTPSANNVYFSDPATSDVTGAHASTPVFPSSLSAINPSYPVPLSMEYMVQVQRQLSPVALAAVAYVGTNGSHQEDSADINTVPLNDPNRLAICGGNCGYTGTAYNANLDRNYLGWSDIGNEENVSKFHYNALQAELRIATLHHLNVTAAYTWSHEIDYGGYLDDPYNINYDKGNSDLNRPQIFRLSYYYPLRFFRHTRNVLARNALGGWAFSGITTLQSGLPTSASLGYDNTGLGGSENSRADVAGPIRYPKTAAHWVSYSSFAAPAPLVFGDSARNAIRGPGLANWDMTLYKSVKMGDRAMFEFRGEVYNVFNHTEFNSINNNFSSGPQQFGQATSVYEPRLIQLGGTISF
jgi:hypothetical protein